MLAAIPASSLQFPSGPPFPSGHSGISGTAVPFGCLVLADFSASKSSLSMSIIPNGIRVFLERLVWIVLLSHTSPSV